MFRPSGIQSKCSPNPHVHKPMIFSYVINFVTKYRSGKNI